MFTEKMARLTSDFTSRILDALRAASLSELTARAKPKGRQAPKKKAARRAATKTVAPAPARPERDVTDAALGFFADRGRKGGTADQLNAHLTELGLASSADLIGALAEQGAIRDAGFRRSTGTGNKTSPVFVSAAS
jgi:hypothetical protein